MEESPISGIIHTKNEAHRLLYVFRTLADLCDEIVVVDMNSSDGTPDLAQNLGAHVVSVEDYGYADPARKTGLQAASHEWVMVLDADELLPSGVKAALKAVVAENLYDAVWIPRLNYMFGEKITFAGWWPDYQLRFFKKAKISYPMGIHLHPEVGDDARVGWMPAEEGSAIVHFNYRTVEDFVGRLNRYTSIEAGLLLKKEADKGMGHVLDAMQEELLTRLSWCERDNELGISLSFLMGLYRMVQWAKATQMDPAAIDDRYEAVRNKVLAHRSVSQAPRPQPSRPEPARPVFPATAVMSYAGGGLVSELQEQKMAVIRWAESLEAERTTARVRIDQLENTLEDRDSWIAKLKKEASAKDDRIHDLENTVRDRDHWVVALQEEIARQRTRIEDLEGTLESREQWIASLKGDLSDRMFEIEGLRSRGNIAHCKLENTLSELSRVQGALQSTSDELKSTQSALNDLTTQYAQTRDELRKIKESLVGRLLWRR